MKKIIVLLSFLIPNAIKAQTIGDHVEVIMRSKPGGYLDTVSESKYSVHSGSSLMVYYLNEELYCTSVIIFPNSDNSKQNWIEGFNTKWIITDTTHWMYYREDDIILGAELRYVDAYQPAIFISLLSMNGE